MLKDVATTHAASVLTMFDPWPESVCLHILADRTNRLLKERLRRTQSGTSFHQSDSAEQLPLLAEHHTENVVIVANRLPGSATKDENGNWKLEVGVWGGFCPSFGAAPRVRRGEQHFARQDT